MSASEGIDTVAKVAKFVGDLAQAAATVGEPALTIVQLLAPWIPGLGPIITDIAVAIPILRQVARYAPVVSEGLEQSKPLIVATIEVGDAILSPLHSLQVHFPAMKDHNEFFAQLDAFFKSNGYTPQDPRFDRMGLGTQS